VDAGDRARGRAVTTLRAHLQGARRGVRVGAPGRHGCGQGERRVRGIGQPGVVVVRAAVNLHGALRSPGRRRRSAADRGRRLVDLDLTHRSGGGAVPTASQTRSEFVVASAVCGPLGHVAVRVKADCAGLARPDGALAVQLTVTALKDQPVGGTQETFGGARSTFNPLIGPDRDARADDGADLGGVRGGVCVVAPGRDGGLQRHCRVRPIGEARPGISDAASDRDLAPAPPRRRRRTRRDWSGPVDLDRAERSGGPRSCGACHTPSPMAGVTVAALPAATAVENVIADCDWSASPAPSSDATQCTVTSLAVHPSGSDCR